MMLLKHFLGFAFIVFEFLKSCLPCLMDFKVFRESWTPYSSYLSITLILIMFMGKQVDKDKTQMFST